MNRAFTCQHFSSWNNFITVVVNSCISRRRYNLTLVFPRPLWWHLIIIYRQLISSDDLNWWTWIRVCLHILSYRMHHGWRLHVSFRVVTAPDTLKLWWWWWGIKNQRTWLHMISTEILFPVCKAQFQLFTMEIYLWFFYLLDIHVIIKRNKSIAFGHTSSIRDYLHFFNWTVSSKETSYFGFIHPNVNSTNKNGVWHDFAFW